MAQGDVFRTETAVATIYEQQRPGDSEIAQFKVGDKWTTYVQPTGDFIIRNEVRRTICRGNLHTGEETVLLAGGYASELNRMASKQECRTTLFQKGLTGKNQGQSFSRAKLKSQSDELT